MSGMFLVCSRRHSTLKTNRRRRPRFVGGSRKPGTGLDGGDVWTAKHWIESFVLADLRLLTSKHVAIQVTSGTAVVAQPLLLPVGSESAQGFAATTSQRRPIEMSRSRVQVPTLLGQTFSPFDARDEQTSSPTYCFQTSAASRSRLRGGDVPTTERWNESSEFADGYS